jgi:hypothetical protein
MFLGIALIVLLLGFLATVIQLLQKGQFQNKQKIAWSIISLFSAFGFFMFCIVLFASMNIGTFQPRLGHYLISKFSTTHDTIGRLTLQNTNGVYEVFPKNKSGKLVGVYAGGKTFTGWFNNGQVTIEPSTAMNVGLMYVLFGR